MTDENVNHFLFIMRNKIAFFCSIYLIVIKFDIIFVILYNETQRKKENFYKILQPYTEKKYIPPPSRTNS